MTQGTKARKTNACIRIYVVEDRNNMRKERIWNKFSGFRILQELRECGARSNSWCHYYRRRTQGTKARKMNACIRFYVVEDRGVIIIEGRHKGLKHVKRIASAKTERDFHD